MKRKSYEEPSITVIAMDDHADIIQTSTQVQTLSNTDGVSRGMTVDIAGLFANN